MSDEKTSLFDYQEQGRSVVSVELLQPEKIETPSLKKHQKSPAQNASAKKQSLVTATSSNKEQFTKPSPNLATDKETPSPDTNSITLSTNIDQLQLPIKQPVNSQHIETIIKTELSKHFYYPKSAQRKNWQGLVILSFIILPSGDIDHIQINRSSGYSVLDNAAMKALQQIERQEDFSLALQGAQLDQLLPVKYKLTN